MTKGYHNTSFNKNITMQQNQINASNGKWCQNTQIIKESFAILVSLLFEDHWPAVDLMIILQNHASTFFSKKS